jgi:hypothetical protein
MYPEKYIQGNLIALEEGSTHGEGLESKEVDLKVYTIGCWIIK